ncbi:type II toxin-antitoxin system VapC family toxin [Gallibacterium melopsittaci]|uniref:Type II toxin-antitoxin system VapC family toxin n=1 Tax=Gallibacterium melopsittaci TaxID=516063 RepID=A0ABV6HXW9_9PAST
MQQNILLDTNKIISILKGNNQDSSWFIKKLNEGQTLFFTTPLIRHEVLRFYDYSDSNAIEYKKAEQFLSALEIINIDKNITDIATDIFRYERTNYSERYQKQPDGTEKRLDKYNFDTMYVASAMCFNLEMTSNDGDICKIKNLYSEMINWKKNS